MLLVYMYVGSTKLQLQKQPRMHIGYVRFCHLQVLPEVESANIPLQSAVESSLGTYQVGIYMWLRM